MSALDSDDYIAAFASADLPMSTMPRLSEGKLHELCRLSSAKSCCCSVCDEENLDLEEGESAEWWRCCGIAGWVSSPSSKLVDDTQGTQTW